MRNSRLFGFHGSGVVRCGVARSCDGRAGTGALVTGVACVETDVHSAASRWGRCDRGDGPQRRAQSAEESGRDSIWPAQDGWGATPATPRR
jgi:hypothetical protein